MRLAVIALVSVLCSGCALFKSLPSQSLDCLKADGSAATQDAATIVQNAIAGNETVDGVEAAAAPVAVEFIECEAQALEIDTGLAGTVSTVTGVPTAQVRAHATSYLQAKGVSIQVAK